MILDLCFFFHFLEDQVNERKNEINNFSGTLNGPPRAEARCIFLHTSRRREETHREEEIIEVKKMAKKKKGEGDSRSTISTGLLIPLGLPSSEQSEEKTKKNLAQRMVSTPPPHIEVEVMKEESLSMGSRKQEKKKRSAARETKKQKKKEKSNKKMTRVQQRKRDEKRLAMERERIRERRRQRKADAQLHWKIQQVQEEMRILGLDNSENSCEMTTRLFLCDHPYCRVPGFQMKRVMGMGSYGWVLEAEDQKADQARERRVAVKIQIDDYGGWNSIMREMEAISLLQGHPHVIDLVGRRWGFTTHGVAGMWMEMPLYSTDLEKWIRETPSAERWRHWNLIHNQLILGLRHLESQQIVHRDFKPANILIDTSSPEGGGWRCVICDFGMCTNLRCRRWLNQLQLGCPPLTGGLCTLEYRCPEMLRSMHEEGEGHDFYDTRADIWSLGVLLLEVIRGQGIMDEWMENHQWGARYVSYFWEALLGQHVLPFRETHLGDPLTQHLSLSQRCPRPWLQLTGHIQACALVAVSRDHPKDEEDHQSPPKTSEVTHSQLAHWRQHLLPLFAVNPIDRPLASHLVLIEKAGLGEDQNEELKDEPSPLCETSNEDPSSSLTHPSSSSSPKTIFVPSTSSPTSDPHLLQRKWNGMWRDREVFLIHHLFHAELRYCPSAEEEEGGPVDRKEWTSGIAMTLLHRICHQLPPRRPSHLMSYALIVCWLIGVYYGFPEWPSLRQLYHFYRDAWPRGTFNTRFLERSWPSIIRVIDWRVEYLETHPDRFTGRL